MELDITAFWQSLAPRDYSASAAELGPDAGAITWGHAMEDTPENRILDTQEKVEAFRAFVRSSGGWNDAECAAFSADELNALCIQWISGDMRECFPDHRTAETIGPEEWAQYESDDSLCHRLFLGTDGRVYFYIGE